MLIYNNPIVILYDNDEMLWYTKIGAASEDSKGSLPLHYTVWGKSQMDCKMRAKQLVTILRNSQTISEVKLI